MKKANTLKIISSIIICTVFLIFAYGSDKQSNSTTEQTTTTQQTDTMPTTEDDNICSVCNGLGVVNTYSYDGCHDVSHFGVSDCSSDHHTSACTSSGEKTCPCCHGTGKSH